MRVPVHHSLYNATVLALLGPRLLLIILFLILLVLGHECWVNQTLAGLFDFLMMLWRVLIERGLCGRTSCGEDLVIHGKVMSVLAQVAPRSWFLISSINHGCIFRHTLQKGLLLGLGLIYRLL